MIENWIDLRRFVDQEITWMPNARLELDMSSIDIGLDGPSDYYLATLLVHLRVRDTYRPDDPHELAITHRRPMPYLRFPVPEAEVVKTIRRILHEVVKHESDEWFRVHGEMVFNPHKVT